MIELVHGDILQADAEALVNTVNCVGAMGRGIALQFKMVFPKIEEVRKRNIRSIAIPPLGCGLGGLSWPDVRSKIEEAFQVLMDVQILLYELI